MSTQKESILNPIFIIGTQRSGTTLLRLILNSHSWIAIPEESTFLMPLLKRKYLNAYISGKPLKALVAYLSLNAQFRLWNYDSSEFITQLSRRDRISVKSLIEEIFKGYCQKQRKKIWGDKTPSFFRKIDILYSVFPDARFIHIVRDGRDVFDSWRKIDSSKNNVAATALDWRYKLFRIEKSFNKIPISNRTTIRYEDLLENPEIIIKSICSVIGIVYEQKMLDFYKDSHNYIGTHHSKLIFNPLNKNNRYKWKKNLTFREVRIFNMLAGHYLKKYDYEVEGNKLKLSDIMFLLRNLSLGLPQRIAQVLQAKMVLEKAVRKGRAADSLSVGVMPKGSLEDK